MPFDKRPAPTRALLLSLMLCASLSACAPHITTTLNVLPCAEMLEASGLLEPTKGADLPSDDTLGSLTSFGDRQTGQLDKSNADKAGAKRLNRTCADWQNKALAEAKKRNDPWWKLW